MICFSHKLRYHRRPAFTLVELLVVIAIIAIIAGLAAFFWPGFDQSERSSQGASNLFNWLLTARQRALLDQAPRGVRLFADPTHPTDPNRYYNKAQFIEVPDPFYGGLDSQVKSVPGDLTKLLFENVDLYGGFPSSDPSLWPVQPGDYVQINDAGLVHQIVKNPNPAQSSATDIVQIAPNKFEVKLVSSLQNNPITTPTKAYKILRSPRLQGEESMDMPFGVGIDIKANDFFGKKPQVTISGSNYQGDYIDILFSPTGTLLTNYGTDKLIFWVREYGLPEDFQGNLTPSNSTPKHNGNPSLVVVYTQTGVISSYAVGNPAPAGNPFSHVK